MNDVSLLLRLRVRHGSWTLNRIMHIAGAGIDDDGWTDRAYQLYLLAIMLAWFVLMAAALVDAVAGAFAAAGIEACAWAMRVVLLVPAAVLLRGGIAGVRTSPLKLSHPDIAYLAASPVSARALVGVAVAVQVLTGGVAAFALGLLLGVGLESAGALALPPAATGIAIAVLVAAAMAARWIAGVARLASGRWRGRDAVLAAGTLVALCLGWTAAVLGAEGAALLSPATFVALAGSAAVAGVAAAVALAVLAPRVNMTAVIDESSLHADLCRFDALSPLDREKIAEYQRRRRFAERKLRFELPSREGRAALVAHAALSHLRQYDGIPSLILHGFLVVPLGVLALLDVGGPVLFLFWLQALVMMPVGVREATRTFRDDMRNRLVRDRLPFGVLELLAFDSLPAFAFTTLLACAVVIVALPEGTSLLAALALAVLVNAGSLLSCGLDAVRVYSGGPRLCYEYGAIALVGASFTLALFAPLPAIVVGLTFIVVALAAAVRLGRECAR